MLWLGLVPSEEKKHHGLSLIIVDMKSPGVTVRPLAQLPMADTISTKCFLTMSRFRQPTWSVRENKGWYHLMQALVYERRSFAPSMYGICKKAVEVLVEYVKNTKHEGKPLSQYAGVRNQLANIAVDLDTLRLFAFQVTWLISQGGLPIYEASRNKLMADMLTERIGLAGAEGILGAYSQVDPYASSLARLSGKMQGWYLGFPGNHIAAGTSEVEKSVIAQFKLGLPKSY